MPELPEIYVLAKQLNDVLPGKTISHTVTKQEKSLNMSHKDFHESIQKKQINKVQAKGKWLQIIFTDQDYLAVNLGMGGELYFNQPHQKENVTITFEEQDTLTISFWWFGHVHFVKQTDHHIIDELGLDLINDDVSLETFAKYIKNKRGAIKNILLDQRKIAGIGNYYIHDILFSANIHPSTKANTLSNIQIAELYHKMIDELNRSIKQNGSFYEQDIYAKKGRFKASKVAYKEGEPCPICTTTIIKVKTGATSSYICPNCQH